MKDADDIRQQAIKRLKEKRDFWQHLVSYVIVNAGLVAVWAFTGAGYFWPAWVLGGWGVGLAFHAFNTFAAKPFSESDIKREMDRLRGDDRRSDSS
jgi:2TM domain-containing protein